MKYLKLVIPNCPICNSVFTGYYLLKTPENDISRRLSHLKKGQKVSVIYDIRTPYKNCFCQSCGNTWHDPLSYKWITKEEWNAYIKERCFTEEIKEYYKINQNKKKQKIEKIKKRKKRKNFIMRFLLKFAFGISPDKVEKNITYYKEMKKIRNERRCILKEEYNELKK